MISKETIESIRISLVDAYNPETIYLFGSYAWGAPTDESDLDLWVVVPDGVELSSPRAVKGYKALSEKWPLLPIDILVSFHSEFENRAKHISSLHHKVQNEAIKLHGK